ncbi:hypothetical protein D3C84_565710 [compost metagenome]
MHFPVGGEEGVDVGRGEVFRRAVGAVDHADLAHGRQRRAQLGRQCGARAGVGQRRQVQHVAGAQGAAAVAAELAEGEGALAAQIVRQLQAAAHGQIRARSAALNGAEAQGAAGLYQQRGMQRLLDAVELHRNGRAGPVRYDRAPAPAMVPRARMLPALISSAVFSGCSMPSRLTGIAAPVTATTASVLKRRVGPLMVISRPAAPSSLLPSRRLPRRRARSSIGPDGGTPTAQ